MKKTIKENSTLATLVLLGLVFMLGVPTSGQVAVSGLTISQLVTSGQTVTLQAPTGDYYYEWTADVGGVTIASGSDLQFTFTAPQVTQEEGSKTMTITLLMRTVEGGCVNSASTDVNVYPLQVCGIGGPAEVGPYESATYSYVGGTTGTITYEWSVDGTAVQGATGPEAEIDWSNYDPKKHTIGLSLTKDYSDVAPGSTNPFRTITCSYPVNITYTSGLELTKTPSVTEAAVGDTVTYTYTLNNVGSIGINDLTLNDDRIGDIPLTVTSLSPGESTSITADYLVIEANLPGPLRNNATFTGIEDKTNEQVSAEANATVDLTYAASLEVTKVPSVTTAAVGDTVDYTYTINNTGTVGIKDLVLKDDKLGAITIDTTALAPGESATGKSSYEIVESDLPGPLTNLATVTAKDVQDQDLTGEARATVDLTYAASLEVTKVPSPKSAKVGEAITYNYTVKNTGTTTLRELALNDDKLGIVSIDQTELAPGESVTATVTYTITADDAPGPLENTVTAEAKGAIRETIRAEATASVTISRESIEPILECVYLNEDETSYTAFFSYNNPNAHVVTIPIGNDNKITPQPEDQGQPTEFEPGQHTAVLAISSDVNALVWHLDGKTATANKNSQRCSVAPCGIDGSSTLCTNKNEYYEYASTATDSNYQQTYEWFIDGESLGSGNSIEIYGGDYELGEHTLSVKVIRSHLGQVWSVTECSMTVKVIPEPVLDIVMIEE